MLKIAEAAVRTIKFVVIKYAEAPQAGVRESGPLVGVDFARLERHANEHRLMALLGIDHRGRPLMGVGRQSPPSS